MNKNITIVMLPILLLSGCLSTINSEVNRIEHRIYDKNLIINELKQTIISLNEAHSDNQTSISKLTIELNRKEERYKYLIGKKQEMEANIRSTKTSIIEGKELITLTNRRLRSDRNVYSQGKCKLPPHSAKPRVFCDTEQKAKEHSIAYCAAPFGCDVVLSQLGDHLDSYYSRFLASESCGRVVDGLRGARYTVDSTLVNLMTAYTDDKCKTEHDGILDGFLRFTSCAMSFAAITAKVNQFKNCTSKEYKNCRKKYDMWRSEPSKKRAFCEKQLKTISKTSISLTAAQTYISEETLKLNKAIKSLHELKKVIKNQKEKIANLKDLSLKLTKKSNIAERKLENELNILKNQREILNKKKDTLEYKIFGK